MYKAAGYTLVDGVTTQQKQHIKHNVA